MTFAILGVGTVAPDTVAAEMTWTVGDHGFVMTLSRRAPGLIGRCVERYRFPNRRPFESSVEVELSR